MVVNRVSYFIFVYIHPKDQVVIADHPSDLSALLFENYKMYHNNSSLISLVSCAYKLSVLLHSVDMLLPD